MSGTPAASRVRPQGGHAGRLPKGDRRAPDGAAQVGGGRVRLAVPAAHVDHRHEAGRVRGVLCFSCDAALGQFKDRPDAMRRAAAYVEGNAWKPTLVAPGVCRLPS
ncbi:endonuclease domain-containing protein [Streptomyces sp. WAC 01529]|uniref:endonuclease domain-containing protein n=1 Tax=Streptomyces sp. WAC 01529 TaxID=2203205 RepID=UPI003204E41C